MREREFVEMQKRWILHSLSTNITNPQLSEEIRKEMRHWASMDNIATGLLNWVQKLYMEKTELEVLLKERSENGNAEQAENQRQETGQVGA